MTPDVRANPRLGRQGTPATKWSIDRAASRRAWPAVVGRGLSEGLGRTLESTNVLGNLGCYLVRPEAGCVVDQVWSDMAATVPIPMVRLLKGSVTACECPVPDRAPFGSQLDYQWIERAKGRLKLGCPGLGHDDSIEDEAVSLL